jgi:hypothetical protein
MTCIVWITITGDGCQAAFHMVAHAYQPHLLYNRAAHLAMLPARAGGVEATASRFLLCSTSSQRDSDPLPYADNVMW